VDRGYYWQEEGRAKPPRQSQDFSIIFPLHILHDTDPVLLNTTAMLVESISAEQFLNNERYMMTPLMKRTMLKSN